MKAIGRHIILEMWGCQNLDSVETAERALREMVVASICWTCGCTRSVRSA